MTGITSSQRHRSPSSRVPVLTVGLALVLTSMGVAAIAPGRAAGVPGPAASVSKPPTPVPAAPDTIVRFTVGLKAPEHAVQDALRKVSDPTSHRYRHFPSRTTISQKFGAFTGPLAAIKASAAQANLSVDEDDTGVFALIVGTARDLEQWTGAPVMQTAIPVHDGTGWMFESSGRLPAAIRDQAKSFLPLDFQFTFPETTKTGVTAERQPRFSGINRGTPDSCLVRGEPRLSRNTYSYNQLRTAYGVDRLPASTAVGRATRVAIIAQGMGFSDTATQVSKDCFGLPGATFTRIAAPGTTGQLPEGPEGDVDVQVVQSVVPPGSAVQVFESPDSRDFIVYGAVFSAPTLPDVTTDSYSNCEIAYTKKGEPGATTARRISNAVMRRLALAGTTMMSAAGDSGSSACVNDGAGPRLLSVNYNTSSPLMTAVGGSRLVVNSQNKRVNEVVWNDTTMRQPYGPRITAGGGGHSIFFGRPWWQPKAWTHSDMRTLPDLSLHASGGPGWPLIMNNPFNISNGSGTSAASPFTASSFAIMAAQERLNGRPPLGSVQPLLYWLARHHPKSFFDITTGMNDLYNKGCCTAKPGYDAASGLGAPHLDRIARSLPEPG
jgi:Pro-kumamolisin, activation domain